MTSWRKVRGAINRAAVVKVRDLFLAAISANVDNDLPRLIYADWLDERGEDSSAARENRPIVGVMYPVLWVRLNWWGTEMRWEGADRICLWADSRSTVFRFDAHIRRWIPLSTQCFITGVVTVFGP